MVSARSTDASPPPRDTFADDVRRDWFAGMTQQAIARKHGVSRPTISRLVGISNAVGAEVQMRNQLAQSVLGHGSELTERETRVLAILRGESDL